MRLLVVALLSLGIGASAAAAAPSLQRVSPRGLQAGATTTLLLEGDGLLPEPQIMLSGVPLTRQTVKPGATAKRVEIEISLDPGATAGIFLLRLAATGGVSNGQAVGVGNLPELPFSSQVSSLPAALSGNLPGDAVMSTTFAGKRGQRIVADVASRRLGAATQPMVHIYDARGTQLAWSTGLRSLGGDARCQLVLPADGEYRVELHDVLYRGAEPSHFRLCLGELNYADFAFPLGVQRNSRTNLELVGTNLPPEEARVEILAGPFAGAQPAPWPALASVGASAGGGSLHLSGGRPVAHVSDYAELTENPSVTGPVELPAAPVGVSGRLLKEGETDFYRLPVTAGQQLRFEVTAERFGSPVDGVLIVEKDKGGQVASNDDQPGTKDPGLVYTVAPGTQSLIVKLRDLNGAGGPDHLYRLSVESLNRPDFALSVADDRVQIPTGGAGLLRVTAKRENYGGPIKLLLEGLPGSASAGIAEIPANADQALVTVTAPAGEASAAGGSSGTGKATTFSLRGETSGIDPTVTRLAVVDNSAVVRYQPWLGSQLAAAIVPAPPLALAWESFSEETKLIPGLPLTAAVEVRRTENGTGAVRFSLLTSQIMPKKTIKAPGKPDQTVDAVERSLRLDGNLQLAADQSAVKGSILVPGDLPLLEYDLALQADLLGADGKTVVATVYAPARRLVAVAPLKLELANAGKIEAPAGIGAVGKLTGKLTRAAGFNTPAKIMLSGLPKDVTSPSVLVAADAVDFELPVSFRFGTAAGDLKGVKLVAVSNPDPKTPDIEARSNEVPLELKIVAGQKPPAERPLLVFEDEEEFVANLKQGGGKATLTTDEKYSGKASCKVTPDQKFNTSMPGMNLKIRQNPGPGEYRFLQFAWKKTGGQTVCIQLAHDGKFGPADGKPAKFRYHAGQGPEPFGASLAVDNKISRDFTLVTRDLFADFGEFTLTGLSLAPVDGADAAFDHIYLGHDPIDFELIKP